MSNVSALAEFLSANAIPFDAENCGPAIDAFLRSCSSDLELLALGEPLHGSEEILRLRNRIFQHLVEHDDFRTLAIEASFPHARAMNDYILGGPGTYEEVAPLAISHGWHQYAATRELIDWMRAYNADPANAAKLHFYGFDLPAVGYAPASPASTLRHALGHLATLDPESAARHTDRITPHLLPDAEWENPAVWRDAGRNKPLVEAATALRVESQKLIGALQKARENFPSTDERLAHEDAVHHAKLARHHLSFFLALTNGDDWAPSLAARDALQADNLEFILARERPRGRVLAFAHNKHLQRSKATWQLGEQLISWSPAGAHLHQTLQRGYAVIGTALTAAASVSLPPAEPGTLESLLAPGTLTLTRNAPPGPADLLARSATQANPTYFPLTPHALSDFDAILTVSLGG